MDFTTGYEVSVLLRSVLFGVFAAACFDLFRLLRMFFPAGPVMLFVQDAIFSLLLITSSLLFLFMANSGTPRMYIFLAAIIGATMWFFSFSRIIFSLLGGLREKFITFVKKIRSKRK